MHPNWHPQPALIALLAALVIWETIWKGIALWRAGRNNQLGWFVVMVILNTAGILPILYLALFQRPEFPKIKKYK